MKITPSFFFEKLQCAYNDSLPFVAYRYPFANTIKASIQKNDTVYYTNDYTEQGFVFAPFDDRKPAILFPLSESEILATTTIGLDKEAITAIGKFNYSPLPEETQLTYQNLIQKSIDFLKTTKVKKVVMSRRQVVDYPSFRLIETFKKVLVTYANALVYIWFHPKIGLWIGATPETLLKVRGTTFTTMALAGTQVYRGKVAVVWQQKEIEEQQFVTDYIVEKLINVSISKPTTIRAGSLLHLCTTISGELSQGLTLHKLIRLLHPTPAVCGLPQQEAKKFILENEGYQREFYTGFLGEINIDNTSSLFVNLRCMQVLDGQLTIYIGGGITKDSIPEKEWEETVAKSQILLKALV